MEEIYISSMKKNVKVLKFNNSASEIWSGIVNRDSFEQICSKLISKYNIELYRAERSLNSLLDTLYCEDILERNDG